MARRIRDRLTKAKIVGAVSLSLLFAVAAAANAEAVIPSGNLLDNPGAEAGSVATDDSHRERPQSWDNYSYVTPMTAVRYGTPGGFPTRAQGLAIDGQSNFFAGGPGQPGDGSPADTVSFQTFGLAGNEVGGGQVQATVSGCLGGYASQDDYAFLDVTFWDKPSPDASGAQVVGGMLLKGPKAAERGNQTKLMPKAQSGNVPPSARSVKVTLGSVRYSGEGTYFDGYADNVSFSLSASGTPAPAPHCTGPGGSGGGGQGGGGSNGGGGTSLLSKVGSSATLSHGAIVLRLRCLAHDSSCKGRLSLSLPKLPAVAKAVTIGKARFSIPAGKTGKVKVKLNRRARRRLGRLSNKRLRRLKVTVNSRIGTNSTKFKLRLRH